MRDLLWLLIPFMLSMWAVIAYHWWKGMEAGYMDEMLPNAFIACFAAFFFTGPFCLVVAYTFFLRFIWLDRHNKWKTPPEA